MLNTIELENYLHFFIPSQEVSDFTRDIVFSINQEYSLMITSKEKPNLDRDMLFSKECFDKTYFIYLLDRVSLAC